MKIDVKVFPVRDGWEPFFSLEEEKFYIDKKLLKNICFEIVLCLHESNLCEIEYEKNISYSEYINIIVGSLKCDLSR